MSYYGISDIICQGCKSPRSQNQPRYMVTINVGEFMYKQIQMIVKL